MEATEFSRVVAIILLPLRPLSVYYRVYQEEVEGQTLLAWFALWWKSNNADIDLVIAYHRRGESSSIETLIQESGLLSISLDSTATSDSYRQIAQRFENHTLLFTNFAAALAPVDIISRCVSTFGAKGANFLEVSGIPTATAPTIISAYLLSEALSLQLPNAAEATPFNIINALLTACTITGDPLPLPVVKVTFDAINEYQIPRNEVPVYAMLSTPLDLATFRNILKPKTDSNSACAKWNMLSRWKNTLITNAELKANIYNFCASPPPSSIRMPSVLFVSNSSAYSGAEESFLQLASNIKGYRKFALVAHEGALTSRLRTSGVTVFCPGIDFSQYNLQVGRFLTSLLRDLSPDLLHINSYVGMPILTVAHALGIPLIQHVRVAEVASYDEQLKHAWSILAVSDFVKKEICTQDVHPDKVHVVYDGIDICHFKPGAICKLEARRRLRIPDQAKVVLMIARFASNKRHDLFVRAIADARKHIDNLYGICVGEVWDSSGVYEQFRVDIENLGLSDAFADFGFQEDIRMVHATADIVVLCSDREPLGTCILEAMAMGLPVIVSNTGGLSEIISDGQNGSVIDPTSPNHLANTLVQLLNDDVYRTRLSNAGRVLAESRFSINDHSKKVRSIYEAILNDKRRERTSFAESERQ